MSKEPNRNDNKVPRFGNRPVGHGEEPGQPKKGPRFSIYWIYAIIIAVLLGANYFNSGSDILKTT